MAEIVLSKVSKRFADGTLAVDGVDLAISDGEFVILVGPSGCGKSTTLNMIAGLESISTGEVIIDGRRMNEIAPRERDIAMVFQSYALYPHMTVRENIDFPLRLAKVDKRTAGAKVEDTARMLDLLPYLDRKPAGLSGGQRQRVAMGRAIVRDPKAFLMDEPLSNLDAKLRVQMRAQIARLQRRLGTTTVYVTHDQSEAMTLGDRIVIMRAGVVQQVGAPEELYEHPHNLFVAGFIGSPTMNFLSAEMNADGMRTAIGLIPYGERVRRAMRERDLPRDVIVGVRPEAFEDVAFATARAPAAPSTPASGFRRLAAGVRAKPEREEPPTPVCTVTGTVDVLEAMGAEKIIYFALDAETLRSEHHTDAFRDIGADDTSGENQLVVRLDPRTRARRGEPLEVAYDPAAVHVFDPATGLNLTEPATAEHSVPA